MDKRIRTLMISEMAAVVSISALAVVNRGNEDEVLCAGMVGMIIGLTAGIIIGACWAIGLGKSRDNEKQGPVV